MNWVAPFSGLLLWTEERKGHTHSCSLIPASTRIELIERQGCLKLLSPNTPARMYFHTVRPNKLSLPQAAFVRQFFLATWEETTNLNTIFGFVLWVRVPPCSPACLLLVILCPASWDYIRMAQCLAELYISLRENLFKTLQRRKGKAIRKNWYCYWAKISQENDDRTIHCKPMPCTYVLLNTDNFLTASGFGNRWLSCTDHPDSALESCTLSITILPSHSLWLIATIITFMFVMSHSFSCLLPQALIFQPPAAVSWVVLE